MKSESSRTSLLDWADENGYLAPFQPHSPTSLKAAESLIGKTGTLRRVVYDLLTEQPCTDEEGANLLGMNPSTYRPRRIELTQRGIVKDLGERKTNSGRTAVIWGVE